ncbi:redoxin domain-containing protein [Bacillus lacus]|uniref:Redoxin domain-containing protein n=1 Tax=Metabacillus lacus TaxID=1983721 RepID=A0A7X2IY01_9BACI|nr:SCO family protein [Metabacillus lacus]MRX71880.1 redoxin domain-containing protein [Metabacillus lacus]
MKHFFTVIILLCLSACAPGTSSGYHMQEFTFKNQKGEDFGTDQLKGKTWIADFIFTNCETVCPPMTANMAFLQSKLQEAGIEAEFVSFSVDPQTDSPQVLSDYQQKFSGNPENWNMLTGYTQKEIETFAREAFQTLVQKPQSSDQVIHSTNFYLIGPDGKILRSYSFTEGIYAEKIIKEIKK